jgi:GTP-binding protein HflX
LFERPRSGERALLVRIGLGGPPEAEELSEFEALARSAGADVLRVVTGTRRAPDPRLFIGSGKAEEIRGLVVQMGADLVVFDHALSPSQERNLEALLKCRVLDRTGLILDIFAQRARSFEGQLQVELAQLKHLATRLVEGGRTWSVRRAVSACAVPGETQLETDRRLLGTRIKTLNARLDKVVTQRETTRRERKRAEIPTVALVGYTNAGKSTLFNRLTGAGAYAANQSVRDSRSDCAPTELPDARFALLADTVGFVRDLPHELVAAFRSTLQEAARGEFCSCTSSMQPIPIAPSASPQVNSVLSEVARGLAAADRSIQQDRSRRRVRREVETGEPRQRAARVVVRADRARVPQLLVDAIGEFLGPEIVHRHIVLKPEEGRARARFFAAARCSQSRRCPAAAWTWRSRCRGRRSRTCAATEGWTPDLVPPPRKLVPTLSHS